ncbi:MAG: acyltransferase [Thermoflexaceae bacterium]|nr:acyltransferase [Thermoflexaceae bacterium]
MKKNAEIELYRFLMILGVAILHFSEDYNAKVFYGGYLGVDFFFILSGYFLMIHFYRHYNSEESPVTGAVSYLAGRIKKLYPPYLLAIILMTVVCWIFAGFGLKKLFLLIYENRWQFLMLHSVGMPTLCIIRSVWFLSPLIILSYLIYFCLCCNKKLFVGLAPVLSILVVTFIAQKYGFFGMHFEYIGIVGGGFVRGFPEMALGVFLAYFVEEYCKEKSVKLKKGLGMLMRSICYVVICWTMYTSEWNFNDFNVLPAFAVLIVTAFLNPFQYQKTFQRCLEKGMIYLGSISYWIFLVHIVVGFVLSHSVPGKNYGVMVMVYILCTVGLSAVLQLLQKNAGKLFCQMKKKNDKNVEE